MAFLSFNEGRKYISTAGQGQIATGFFLLSTKDTTTLVVGDTLAGGVAEITGTGYARQSEAAPTPTLANPTAIVWAQKTYATGAATDWPAAVKSVIYVTTSDNTGKAICAWDLNGTTGRAMNVANTTENVTPTLNLA